jgi:hypothetical protein
MDSTGKTFRRANFIALRDLYVTALDRLVCWPHRHMATAAQIASMTPNGQAPGAGFSRSCLAAERAERR